jgi:tetratricopeptide (TPR) repeat protein
MGKDIQPLLDGWPYDPGKLCVRKIKGADGREKIQLRIEMGILQMEMTGRPDGQRPHGYESLLAYYQAQAVDKTNKNEDYTVNVETCMMLQLEALQYYHRRISFLELEDYERAKKDAERNLDLFDFVKEYASDEEDKLAFELNRPFVIGHRVRAAALLKLETDDYDGALIDIEEGIEEIQSLFTEFDRLDLMEDSEEVEFLREWADEIKQDRPRSLNQDLSDQLKEAVALEDFEKAAEIRDRIHAMAKAGKNF